MIMSGIALSFGIEAGRIRSMQERESGEKRGTACAEHDECGESVFYPLSPVCMTLYYSFVPEAIIA
jgi:hypothetical protein